MQLSPGIRNAEPYPFEELDRRKREALDAGRELIDFGVGDPRDETPAFIREALREAVVPDLVVPARRRAPGAAGGRSSSGSAALRRGARSGDRPAPDAGQQGADLLARAGGARSGIGTRSGRRDGARLHHPRAGRSVRRRRRRCACRSRRPTSSPTSTASATDTWERTAMLWLNYPNNPTGAVAPLAFLERRRRARAPPRLPPRARRGVQRALVRRRAPRVGRSSCDDLTNVVVLNTLSKRSNMTGYRSRVRGRRPAADRGAEGAPALDGGDAAGVRPASLRRRMGGRGARARSSARATRAKRAIFLELFAREGRRGRGERRGHVSLGRGPRRSPVPGVGARAARARHRASRPDRSSDRRARGTCGWPWCRRSRTAGARVDVLAGALADRGGARVNVERHADLAAGSRRASTPRTGSSTPTRDRGGHRPARPRRGARGGADGRGLGRERVGEEGRAALLPDPRDGDDRVRSVRVPRQAAR